MSEVKKLQTRIALKYDTYANWTSAPGKDLVLLKGELGICEIPNANAASNVAPTVLFKVGDGTKAFSALPWASAKAADVYSWAKASDVTFANGKITFVGGAANGTDKVLDLNSFATDAEVEAIRSTLAAADTALAGRVSTLEGLFSGDDSVQNQIDGLDERLDVLEGTGNGSVSKALADAKSYADGKASDAQTAATNAAKTYTDGKVSTLSAEDSRLAGLITTLSETVSTNETDIEGKVSALDTAYKAADTAINNKIGTVASGKTVVGLINEAKTAAQAAAGAVEALEDGAVATNAANISALDAKIDKEIQDREEADEDLSDRLDKVEAFFVTSAGEELDTALDTLVEIQDYLNGEGSATSGLMGRISTLEGDVEDIQGSLASTGSIGSAIASAQSDATQGISDAAAALAAAQAADTKAQNAQTTADRGVAAAAAVEQSLNTYSTSNDAALAKVRATANAAAVKATVDASISSITGRLDTLEANESSYALDSDLDAAVADITTLQGIVVSGANANSKLRTAVDSVTNKVNNATTGLAATKTIADNAAAKASANEARIEAIEDDYLKEADLFIIDCGSASTVTHNATT